MKSILLVGEKEKEVREKLLKTFYFKCALFFMNN